MLILVAVSTVFLTMAYIYAILKLYLGIGLLKLGENRSHYRVSVVVAARNEEQHIRHCLMALLNQTYPRDRYEIMIVDDRSHDNTAKVVQNFCQRYPQVKLVQVSKLPAGFAPKKYALETGIHAATGEIILTTDADCVPGPGWIQGMIRYFDPAVGLVAGFSPLEKQGSNTIFSRILSLDALSLAAVAAGSFGLGRPLTCSGRNLAYRKETFLTVNGFSQVRHLISGDDDLFLHLVQQKTDWKLRYAVDQQTYVPSQIPATVNQFVNQRIRHASKGRYYPRWLKVILTAFYILNFDLLILAISSLIISRLFWLWFICWLGKSLSESIFLYRAAHLFHYKKALLVFPLAMLLHVPYVVLFGLWGQWGTFRWKDDTFKTHVE